MVEENNIFSKWWGYELARAGANKLGMPFRLSAVSSMEVIDSADFHFPRRFQMTLVKMLLSFRVRPTADR